MADLYPGLEKGAISESAIVINMIANAALNIGDAVVLAAAGTGELLPRAATTTTQGAALYGVVVGGDAQGTFSGSSAVAAAAAGDTVAVCIRGRCKVNVTGAAIVIGDKLTADNVAGFVEEAAAADEVFGIALQASTTSDVFVMDIQREGIL